MTIKSALRDLNNAVLDLQCADYNTFERPLERLSLALNSEALRSISNALKSTADFETFLQGAHEGGSMMGSARLIWPQERDKELGLVIHIIERGSKDPNWFMNLAHTYYYSGRKIVGDIRKITSAIIVPFNRNFANHIEEMEADLPRQSGGTPMTVETDKEDLLKGLYDMARQSGARPSVQDARIKLFPDWGHDRLLAAAQALLDEGAILNASGAMVYVDLSSGARKRMSDQEAVAATGVTYNIGAMHNSPLQHISAGGHGNQTTTYSSDDLRSIVALYRQHVDELALEPKQRQRADAQVATIDAQLQDEPDPSIIKAAGRSLKTIIEGAIGGAAGNALAAAPIWAPLLSMFS